MKRRIAMALTLIMMMALILPQTALAATRYYLDVSITDGTKTVSGESGYLSLTGDSLTGGVVQVINEKYSSGALKVFGSAKMEAIIAAGLAAYGTSDHSGWAAWVETYKNDGTIKDVDTAAQTLGLKAKLADLDTKVNALTEDTAYKLSYTPDDTAAPAGDGAHGKTYTVTITLKSYTTGGSSSGGTTTTVNKAEVKDGTNGSASASPVNAAKGAKVTVTVNPDEGYVASRILVTDKDGNKIQASYEGNGKYSFTMPEGGVTVTPVFRKQTASPAETGVAELLNVDDHTAFMIGDDKGNFRPNDSITRAEVAQVFYRLLEEQNVAITKSFDDVAGSAWYAAAVNTLASMGILNGTSSTAYEPERAITRAEFTAICTRFAKAYTGSMSFTDVPESFWAYSNIAAAAEFGWIVGDGTGKFNPNADITRAEAAAIVNRMLGRLSDFDAIDAGEGKSFPDVSTSFWGFYDIAEATSGHDHSLDTEKLHEEWK